MSTIQNLWKLHDELAVHPGPKPQLSVWQATICDAIKRLDEVEGIIKDYANPKQAFGDIADQTGAGQMGISSELDAEITKELAEKPADIMPPETLPNPFDQFEKPADEKAPA
jgi:hypothetical protein